MKVLCVGKVCLDIVNYADAYPLEDTDHTIPYQRWTQGGNAANNCVVFHHLKSAFCSNGNDGFQHELFASFGTDLASTFVRRLLKDDHGVQLEHCPIIESGNGLLSTSCIVVNRKSGTRTIVHARNDVHDVNFQQFQMANFQFDQYDWINFETRDVEETKQMLDMVLKWRRAVGSHHKPVVSVEVEKDRMESECLLQSGADYLFVGKDFCQARNCKTMQESALYVSSFLKSSKSTIVCPWGDEGACILDSSSEEPLTCPAYKSGAVIDTLGAGDTFFGSFIFAKCQLGKSSSEALKLACFIAGLKCTIIGYADLGDKLKKIISDKGIDHMISWY